jgi:DNA-binding transcriptional MocR family regulator
MFPRPEIDLHSEVPLYRQLHQRIREFIRSGRLAKGERLPATRGLAGMLGLNRTTVSAAYDLLESDGLISGHVGRGSFVTGEPSQAPATLNWEELLPAATAQPAPPEPASEEVISFATSRPAEALFPLEAFRASCQEVLRESEIAAILQLGSPGGYPPLQHYLLEAARRAGVARLDDDVLVTNGCQQALDLIQRVLVRPGDTVALEDPVYAGPKNLFLRAGARLAGVPVGPEGLEVAELERLLAAHRVRLLVATSNFQNPTGATLPAVARRAILRLARAAGVVVVENDIYGDLRYQGEPAPLMKRLDESGDTVLLGSFSKITFPGLRVGWVIGPRALVSRLAEAKQWTDLHTDQLAQAVLLRFAESGRLEAHRAQVRAAGRERLGAVLAACERCLPAGTTFTRPEGGMNLWVRLPEPLDASELLGRAQREGVSYLPGRYFEVSRRHRSSLRLSFAGLAPEKIRTGLAILGRVFSDELVRARSFHRHAPVPAMV